MDYTDHLCPLVKQINEHMIQAMYVQGSMQARQHYYRSQNCHLLVELALNRILLELLDLVMVQMFIYLFVLILETNPVPHIQTYDDHICTVVVVDGDDSGSNSSGFNIVLYSIFLFEFC